jgi:hypothetical protein
VLAESLDSRVLDLVVTGCEAEQQGRAPEQSEAEALQTYTSEWARLCQRSGFSSAAEFEQYCQRKPWASDPSIVKRGGAFGRGRRSAYPLGSSEGNSR